MNRMRLCLLTALIVSIFFLTSCATTPVNHTKISGTWKDEHFNKKLSNFLIISLSDEIGMRAKVENALVRKFNAEGVHAEASSDLMPIDEEIDRKTVRAAMVGKTFDGVLVSRLIEVASDSTYVPPAPNASFEAGFSHSVPIITSPGHTERRSVVTLQTDLYDPSGQGHLVWSMTSQSFDPSNVTELIDNVSDAIVSDLRAKGLI
jgi:hypothetical protein